MSMRTQKSRVLNRRQNGRKSRKRSEKVSENVKKTEVITGNLSEETILLMETRFDLRSFDINT